MNKIVDVLDDRELLRLISDESDKNALAELYNRYRQSLGGFLRGKLYQDKLVDEVYNDVMLTVWQKAQTFRGESKVSTWIYGIAYRICLSHVRKELKHTEKKAEAFEFDAIAQEEESELVEQLRVAVTELSEDHRSVVELAYFHGHSLAEIADVVQCPENTVKTRLYHARQKLKAIIESNIVK